MKRRLIVLVSILAIAISSCSDPLPSDSSWWPFYSADNDFFPLNVGNQWTYDYYYIKQHQGERWTTQGTRTWLIFDLKIFYPDSIVYTILDIFNGTDEYKATYPYADTTKSYFHQIDSLKKYINFTQLRDGTLKLGLYHYNANDSLPVIKRYYKEEMDSTVFIIPMTKLQNTYKFVFQKNVGLKSYQFAHYSHTGAYYTLFLKTYFLVQ